MSNKIDLTEKIFDLFRNHDDYYLNTEQLLLKFKKPSTLQQIKNEIGNNLKKKLGFVDKDEDPEKINDFLNKIENHIKNAELKFYFKYSPKQEAFCDELKLKNSVNNLEIIKKDPKIKIIWKPYREILHKENYVILPEKINFKNFTQGYIGDCYFISCVNALAHIPQLLYFIMGLTDKNVQNENPQNLYVNFFIDGNWKKIKVEDSFPCFMENNELVGAQPDENELFMMILEKAWAKINGGYDQIEGGYPENIFELFLGSKCYSFPFNGINDINVLYKKVKENEKKFGTLSLVSSKYYVYNKENHDNLNDNFNKEYCLNKGEIWEEGNNSYHAYNILKTLEIRPKSNNLDIWKKGICRFFIIENPHGKMSNLVGSGIELKKIEHILEQNFGSENKSQYEFILKKNEKYGYQPDKNKGISKVGTGIIYMPLEYFKDWQDTTSVCIPHYGCFSYTWNITNELGCLYIFKIKINEKQSFTCQVCFPNYRVHKSEIDKIEIKCQLKNEEIMEEEEIILYYKFCGIKIIKNNENLDAVENYFCYGNEDLSSIKELSCSLEEGEYFVMIYIESSLNSCVFRFLSENDMNIVLIDKIDNNQLKNKFYYDSTEKIFANLFGYNNNKNETNDYKKFLNSENKVISYCDHQEIFLPGIKEYYSHFKTLSEIKEIKDLSREDAIYKINKRGEAYYYDIIEPYSFNKIFRAKEKNGKTKYDFVNMNTLQFIDNFGYPYQVKNIDELVYLMKINNKNPVSCLLSEFDENTNVLSSSITHIKIFKNNAINEDILVVTNKSGKILKRNQQPLFIIILDISGSMSYYYEYLQNNIIPKLLTKLGYNNENKDLIKIIKENNISNSEILQVITCKYKFNDFLERYDLGGNINPEYFKNYCDNIIPLITFSDDSELYFFSVSDFENCKLSGGGTHFKNSS